MILLGDSHRHRHKKHRSRNHVSPFSIEEQLFIRIRLGFHSATSRFVVGPVTRLIDSTLLTAAWTCASLLGVASVAGVVGGRVLQQPAKQQPQTQPIQVQPQVTLSIIIPLRNAAESIVPVLHALYRGIETSGISAEILIVDANSTDCTCDIIYRLIDSWREAGLFSYIEDGRTGLEGIQMVTHESTDVGRMMHAGFLKSSGSFILFTSQDALLPDDYPSLIHQALSSTPVPSRVQPSNDIELGCFVLDTHTPVTYLAPLLKYSNFKTYYLSLPTLENTLFMKSQTYLQISDLTLSLDKCTSLPVQPSTRDINTLTLLVKEINLNAQAHLVVVDTPVKLYGSRWFTNPVITLDTVRETLVAVKELPFYQCLRCCIQDHLAYIKRIFYEKD